MLGKISIQLEAQLARFESDMGRAARLLEKQTAQMARQAADTRRQFVGAFAGIAGSVLSAQAAWTAFAASVRAADTFANMKAKISLVTDGLKEQQAAQQALFAISQRTRASLEETSGLYVKLAQSSQALRNDQVALLGITETINKAMTVSGASAGASAAALQQLGQALAANRLGGEELNSVLEQAPRLAKAIADGIGRPLGDLKKLAEQGKLTSDVVIQAIQSQAAAIDREFGKMPVTVSSALQQVENAFLQMIGTTDQASGSSTELAGAISGVAKAMSDPQFVSAVQSTVTWIAQVASAAMEAAGALREFFAENAKKGDASLINRRNELESENFALERRRRPGTEAWWQATAGVKVRANAAEMADIDRMLAERARAARWADVQGGSSTFDPSKGPVTLKDGPDKAAEARAKQAAAAAKRAAEAQAAFRREVEMTAAQLEGPIKAAEEAHTQRVGDYTRRLAEGHALQADVTRAIALSAQQRDREVGELQKQADLIGQMIAEGEAEVRWIRMTNRERAVEERLLRKVEEAKRAQKALSPEYLAMLRREAEAQQDAVDMAERSASTAENFRGMWTNAIDSVAAAFGDWITGGIKSFKEFGRTLGEIAKRYISDVIAQFAKAQLAKLFTGWMNSASQGTGWWATVAKFFGGGQGGNSGNGDSIWKLVSSLFGGGSGGQGGQGGGVWGWLSSAASTVGGWFGLGGSGAAAGGATGAASGSASASAGAAGAVAWVAAILAGMYMNAQWYKAGWDVEGQRNQIMKDSWWVGADNFAVLTADKLLRNLGVNGKWASILSGSAGIAKAWGYKKPELFASGITGSVGFDGITGQNYATIKQAGGWFRSDKYTDQFAALDGSVDRAFDMAAQMMRLRALDLAKQVGVSISAALGAVRIDLGRMQLDKDPEKARKQIEDKIAEVMERLSGEAINALGFASLLDDGFAATEVMGALSAAIELVTGGTEKLGRALTELEKANVARAVEYFEGLAIKNGTSLGAEVQRVTTTLQEYAGLITNIDAALRTAGLSQYQKAQLEIEATYRGQIKAANELAKSLGLSGARAEDLAKIEQLRALNMANLQAQLEAQKSTFLQDLGLSELSTLTDADKLQESMQLLRDAVGAGDLQRAQQMAQQALGLGRNLYASGADYGALSGQVTGLIGGMRVPGLDAGDTSMGDLADLLMDLPGGIATALFNLLYTQAPAAPVTPPPVTPPGSDGVTGPGAREGGPWRHMLQLMADQVAELRQINAAASATQRQQLSDSLATLNR